MKKNVILGGIIGATIVGLYFLSFILDFIFSHNNNWQAYFKDLSLIYIFASLIVGFIIGAVIGFFISKFKTINTEYSSRYWLNGGMLSAAFFTVVIIGVFITKLWDIGWSISAYWNQCGDMGCGGQMLIFLLVIGLPLVFMIGSLIGIIYGRFIKIFHK
jgi:hypothetical protein